MTKKTTKLVVGNDVESDTVKSTGYATATVVVDGSTTGELITVATTISATESPSKCERSVISIEPSVLQLVTIGEGVDPNARQAQLCCGCCCDLLRACIIVNIVYISYAILALLVSWWGMAPILAMDISDYDDDFEIRSDMDDTLSWMVVVIIQLSSGMLFASLGIIGAAKFTPCLVLSCGIWYCIDLLISSLSRVWPAALMKGFFAYPHFALFMALKGGKITRENYLVERHCCCDSKNQRE
mmetsp:Transcript_15837/g.36668  ORF Transcript_15837/g.36668 Transcript_15837/m.36668 type:complete len:242 (+) Transcript_15837:143-868(+)|eukprot:CAMPEP_0197189350 /NCGR_PEP_ID=MMETSP1423-20130617/19608_1 /TAXON_ID=476441 /ORGANISM="Pseudo-nitzschia heimii, Strain UNC1101" /LENGTH=241 /DNA_ID=CAMNT_0042641437 /DNA_START=108 /DNA_END=833 /DNA_ORIENTATION=+